MSELVKLENIYSGYHKADILFDINAEIKKGEFLGIIGPNGCGKSTLLRTTTGYLKPSKGIITYSGRNIIGMPALELSRKIAFVGQELALNFQFTIEEVVLMGRIPYLSHMQQETKKDFEAVKEALELTGIANLRSRLITELSSGERQLALIAKAIAQKPKLLFLDEPTSHLDIGHQISILNLLRDLNKGGITIVCVLHDLNLAAEYCDRVILLSKGRLYKAGTPQEILTYENIEKIYNTTVLVNKNPVSKKPHILLISNNSE